jgi:dienelactone hydrolase
MRLLTTFILTLSCALPVQAHWQEIDLQAADGVKLKASYISPARMGPAMLLVHQCNMDRSSWQTMGRRLHDAGVHVLALDLRGFGDSEGQGLRGQGGFAEFLKKSSGDVDLAYDFLAQQADVDPARIAAGGASCGAMLTSELAMRRDVKALMLLSGPPSDEAIAHISTSPELAVFAAATDADTITPGVDTLLRTAVNRSAHPNSTAKVYPGTEHGLPMFAKNVELEPLLMTWLVEELLND